MRSCYQEIKFFNNFFSDESQENLIENTHLRKLIRGNIGNTYDHIRLSNGTMYVTAGNFIEDFEHSNFIEIKLGKNTYDLRFTSELCDYYTDDPGEKGVSIFFYH